MKNKLIFGLVILILVILSFSAVSATEPVSTNTSNDSNSVDVVNPTTNNPVLSLSDEVSQSKNNDSASINSVNENTARSYTDLANLINNNTNGSVNLTCNYTYNSNVDKNYENGININNKNLTINGNGYTINSNHNAEIFKFTNCNVSIEKLNLINGGNLNSNDNTTCGGAIYASDSVIEIYKGYFINNTAPYGGGAIYAYNSTLSIVVANFTNNSANKSGGAIYVKDCDYFYTGSANYINNTAGKSGGVISLYNTKGIFFINHFYYNHAPYGGVIYSKNSPLLEIVNSLFENNTATYAGVIYASNTTLDSSQNYFHYNNASEGGVLYIHDSQNMSIFRDFFWDNTAMTYGAMGFYNITGLISQTIFRNNTAYYTGAIGGGVSDNLTIYSCGFYYNVARINSGALHFYNVTGFIDKGSFISNSAGNFGGAINLLKSNLTITRTNFKKNNAIKGGVISNLNSTLNMNYNSIYNNTDTIYLQNASNVNLDYNWWESNNNPENNIHDINSTYNLNNWIIVTLTDYKTNLTLGESLSGILSNKHYTDGNNTYNYTTIIPGSDYSYIVNDNYSKTYTYRLDYYDPNIKMPTVTVGNFTFSLTIDNQTLEYNFTVNPLKDKNTIFNNPNSNLDYSLNNTYSGILTDTNNNKVVYRNVSLNLTRLSSGASKVYNVTTDSNGEFSLPITLAPGKYLINATFYEDNDYYSTNTLSSLIIKGSNMSASNIHAIIGDNITYTGKLLNLNNTGLSNKTVSLKIVRISDGASKVYNVTTDENGSFKLPIHLSQGNYHIEASNPETLGMCNSFVFINNGTGKENYVSYVTFDADKINSTSKLTYSLISARYSYYLYNNNITIEITRLSDGASKNYTVITKHIGNYLPINLNPGVYSAKIIYSYSGYFYPSVYIDTFTISK